MLDECAQPMRYFAEGSSHSMKPYMLVRYKFLVRLRPTTVPGDVVEGLEMAGSIALEAESVWTGSFNFTSNASFSFENAVVIHDAANARSYFEEFSHVASLSEPLD